MQNYYEILNLTRQATADEIKLSYRKLAMKWHPDRNQNDLKAEEKFKQIQKAYEVLSDPYKRKEYDWSLDRESQKQRQWKYSETNSNTRSSYSRTNNEDFDRAFNDAFADFFRQKQTYTESNRYSNKSSNKQNAKNTKPQQRGTVKLSFWEAIFGCSKIIELSLNGRSKPKTKVRVSIPAGIDDKDKFNITIAGHTVKMTVAITEDPKIKRKNLDLYVNIEVPFTTAALGGVVSFPHWDGDIDIIIPAGVKSGQAILVKNKGIKKNIFKGDLYVIANITIPTKLTDEQKYLLEQFRNTEQDNNEGIKKYFKNSFKNFFG